MKYGELEKQIKGKYKIKEPKKENKISILFVVTAMSL